ncbi:MAG: toll/interleukin-1 receptor domain-containing protein [Candidatus Cybelea sp.]
MLIFVSYARDDDQTPRSQKSGDVLRYGFVTTMLRRMKDFLTNDGFASQAELFLDKRNVRDNVQFEDAIPAELDKADALLVVLSRNWVQRPWCQKELQYFVNRFPTEIEARRRIIVVNKNEVSDGVPSALQGQNGVRFFEADEDQTGGFLEYFDFSTGQPLAQFDAAVKRLVDIIEHGAATQAPPVVQVDGKKPARRIFVAKPAPDMEKRYRQLVNELQQRGFAVVPEPSADFADEMTADTIAADLDTALRDAEISLHLLGNSLGFLPAGSDKSIAQLQCVRAAARRTDRPKNAAGVPFQRLFWAPKVLIDVEADEVVEAGRDPQAVCDRFTQRIADDSVLGENFPQFTAFVVDRLAAIAPQAPAERLPEGANIYLQFQQQDEQYAAKVGAALKAKKLDVDWQRQGGPDVLSWHRKFLRECDAVVVCWSQGFDELALSPFEETKDPRQCGRDRDFACRGLVVGPPKEIPGKTIALSLAGDQRDEPDLVLDLTEYPDPPPGAFDRLVEKTEHPAKAGAVP